MWSCKIEQACSNFNEPYMWSCKIEQACSNSNEPDIWFCKIEQACSFLKQGYYVKCDLVLLVQLVILQYVGHSLCLHRHRCLL